MKNMKNFERRTMTLWTAAAALLCVFGIANGYASTFNVTNLSDHDPGSLRDMITQANANGNPATTDVINVLLAPGTIALETPLPAITEPVIIQTNTGNGRVELNGAATHNQARLSIGFDFQAPGCATASPACTLWGFAINRFGEAGIRVGPHSDNVVITQNYIGTDPAGATVKSQGRSLGVTPLTIKDSKASFMMTQLSRASLGGRSPAGVGW